MFCAHCGSRLPDEAAFCPTCGREAHRGPSCPNCTYRLPVGAAFCARCGRGVAAGAGRPVADRPEAVPSIDAAGTPLDTGDGQGDSPGTVPASRVGDPIPGGGAPLHASTPAPGERVLPSNAGRWVAPEAEARRLASSSARPAWSHDAPYGVAVPDQIDPSVGGVYAHAWRTVRNRFWRLFAIGLVAVIVVVLVELALDGIGSFIEGATGSELASVAAPVIAQLIGGWPIWAGVQYANLQAVRSGRAEIDDIFAAYRRGLASLVVAQVVTTALVAIAFVLLVVPGIIVGIRLAFVTLLVVDEGYGPLEAISESWRRTAGFGWTIFGIGLMAIPVVVVGLLALVVGLVPAAMVIALTTPTMFAAATEARGRRRYG